MAAFTISALFTFGLLSATEYLRSCEVAKRHARMDQEHKEFMASLAKHKEEREEWMASIYIVDKFNAALRRDKEFDVIVARLVELMKSIHLGLQDADKVSSVVAEIKSGRGILATNERVSQRMSDLSDVINHVIKSSCRLGSHGAKWDSCLEIVDLCGYLVEVLQYQSFPLRYPAPKLSVETHVGKHPLRKAISLYKAGIKNRDEIIAVLRNQCD